MGMMGMIVMVIVIGVVMVTRCCFRGGVVQGRLLFSGGHVDFIEH